MSTKPKRATASRGAKRLYLIKRRKSVSREEFIAHWFAGHMPPVITSMNAAAAAGELHAFRYSVTLLDPAPNGEHVWDGMGQLSWNSAPPAPPVAHGTTPKRGHYDLILMDRHMPNRDGCSATREIRRRERMNAGQRTPIIAFTADAAAGAREECLDAGMDAYLTKPIDRAKLVDCIKHLLRAPCKAGAVSAPADTSAEDTPPVEWLHVVAALDGDEVMARELATLFMASSRADLNAIATAIEQKDYDALGITAHALQGATADLRATAVSSAAQRLEVATRAGEVDHVPALAAALEHELHRTITYLERVMGSCAA